MKDKNIVPPPSIQFLDVVVSLHIFKYFFNNKNMNKKKQKKRKEKRGTLTGPSSRRIRQNKKAHSLKNFEIKTARTANKIGFITLS